MRPSVSWAAVFSRWPLVAQPDPHPASVAVAVAVAVETAGLHVVCSALPWPLSGPTAPWDGHEHPTRMRTALRAASGAPSCRSVWGGNWNQPLTGNIAGFSRVAQESMRKATERLNLRLPTMALPGRPAGQATIDHSSPITVESHRLREHSGGRASVRPRRLLGPGQNARGDIGRTRVTCRLAVCRDTGTAPLTPPIGKTSRHWDAGPTIRRRASNSCWVFTVASSPGATHLTIAVHYCSGV